MSPSLWAAARDHLRLLLAMMGGRVAISAALMLATASLEALAMVLLVLLLGIVGIDVSQGGPAGLAAMARRALGAVGLGSTLEPVLGLYAAVVIGQALVARWQTVVNLGIEYDLIARLRQRLFDAIATAGC